MINKVISYLVNKMVENKVKIRTTVSISLTIIAYGFTIFYLFGNHDIFGSIVCIFFLFISFHFMCLDIKKVKLRHMILILISISIIDVSILFMSNWESNIWLILAVITLNGTLGALFDSLYIINFRSIQYFLRGGYIFTLFITITYSIALIGMFQQFPFTCQGLKGASNKLIEFVEKPFTFSMNKINGWKDDNADLQSFVANKTLNDDLDYQVESILLRTKDTDISLDSGSFLSPIIWQFNQWKSNAVDQIMAQQESYSVGMCDMLLEEINSKYSFQEFKLSVILLTYLLLYGFVRVAIFIMSFFGFLIFKLLYWVGLYKIKKVIREVDEIK